MDGLELGNEVVGCYFVVARGVVSCVCMCFGGSGSIFTGRFGAVIVKFLRNKSIVGLL